MPIAAKKLGELTRINYEARRPSAAKRGYGRMHQRWRLLILHRDPICRKCGVESSIEADHIVPVEQGGEWSMENGQGLCKTCHSQKTRHDNQARGGQKSGSIGL
jgi:5-methylcytosine-specific restriction endonuclease McrA